MIKYPKCNLISPCVRCGFCCHFKTIQTLSSIQEKELRIEIFKKTGILYLHSLNKITITISKKEKYRLIKLAKEQNIIIKIIPLKAIFIKKKNKKVLKILDYFIDEKICPFYNEKDKICNIYNYRPKICKVFPNKITHSNFLKYEKIKYQIKSNNLDTFLKRINRKIGIC